MQVSNSISIIALTFTLLGISLGIGEPDFITPWRIRDAAYRSLDYGKTSYTSNMGSISLRNEVSKYVNSRANVLYNPEDEILITVGVSEGLDLAIEFLSEGGFFLGKCFKGGAEQSLLKIMKGSFSNNFLKKNFIN